MGLPSLMKVVYWELYLLFHSAKYKCTTIVWCSYSSLLNSRASCDSRKTILRMSQGFLTIQKTSGELTCDSLVIDWLIVWLDWIVFHAVSAIFQPLRLMWTTRQGVEKNWIIPKPHPCTTGFSYSTMAMRLSCATSGEVVLNKVNISAHAGSQIGGTKLTHHTWSMLFIFILIYILLILHVWNHKVD